MDKTARSITWAAVGAAGLVGAAMIVSTALQNPAPTGPGTFTATGTFRLVSYAYWHTSGACSGLGDFTDITDGVTVKVTDQMNTTDALATGVLEHGQYVDHACVWSFTVADIPTGHVYAVAIGAKTSEEVTEDQMRAHVTITDGLLTK